MLYPPVLRDLLVGLAVNEFYYAKWSEEIFSELKRNLLKKGRLAETAIEERLQHLQDLLPDAMAKPSKAALRAAKNNLNDRHVVATAISSKAEIIVTLNIKDFEPLPVGIKVMTPDVFLQQFADQKSEVMRVLEWIASKWPEPPTVDHILRKLELFIPEFAAELQYKT